MMGRGRETRTFLVILLVSAVFLSVYPGSHGKGKTKLQAESIEIEAGSTVARGDVKLVGGGFTLYCQNLRIAEDGPGRKMTAEGSVRLKTEEVEMNGSSLSGELLGEQTGSSKLELTEASGTIGEVALEGETIVIELRQGSPGTVILKNGGKLTPGNQTTLKAEKIELNREGSFWSLDASGEASYSSSSVDLNSKKITGEIDTGKENGIQLDGFTGENISGRTKTDDGGSGSTGFSFTGEKGDFGFRENELTTFSLNEGSLTNCDFRPGEVEPAYLLESEEINLFPGEFLIAETSEIKSFGFPVWKSPNYIIPLEDFKLPSRSYFPRFGFSGSEGLTFEGAVPVYFNRRNFGNVLADYSAGRRSIGLGVDYFSGGKRFSGLVELYGKLRSGEANYLELEAEFEGKTESWPDLTGVLDLRRGLLQGEDYDGNEWRLNLNGIDGLPGWSGTIARNETVDTADNSSSAGKRSMTRLPEIAYERKEVFPGLPGQHYFSGKFGYYREKETSWSNDRTGVRLDFKTDFSIGASPLNWLDLSLNSSGRFDGYLFGEVNGLKTRTTLGLTPTLELKGPGNLEVRYDHRAKLGNSPFIFDSLNSFGKLSFTYDGSWKGFYNRLGFHYDFVPSDGFSNLNYELEFQRGVLDQEFGLEYDLSSAALEAVTASTLLSREFGSLEVSSGYNFKTGSITETELGVEFTGARNGFNLRLTGNPPETLLEEISGGVDLTVFEDWSVSLTGKYDFQDDEVSKLSYSVYNTLQNCLKVGVSGGLGGVWLNAELAGF